MNKIYYLKTCDTCKKILIHINNLDRFTLQDLKLDPLTEYNLLNCINILIAQLWLINAHNYIKKKIKRTKVI